MASHGIRPSSHRFSQRLYGASWVLLRGIQAQTPFFREVKTQLSPDLCGLNCWGHQIPHPHEVVGGRRERENPPDRLQSTMPRLTERANRFDPAKDFFDALPFPLAYLIAFMPRRATINLATARTLG